MEVAVRREALFAESEKLAILHQRHQHATAAGRILQILLRQPRFERLQRIQILDTALVEMHGGFVLAVLVLLLGDRELDCRALAALDFTFAANRPRPSQARKLAAFRRERPEDTGALLLV